MQRRDLILALGAAAALAACQQQSPDKAEPPADGARAMTDPAIVVRQLYDGYIGADAHPPSFNEAVPWSAAMTADLAAMYARTQAGDAPPLDFDPIVDAQDFQVSEVTTVTEALSENSHATVRASFSNMGRPTEVVYDMVWEDDRWKVANVRTAQWDMHQIVTRAG